MTIPNIIFISTMALHTGHYRELKRISNMHVNDLLIYMTPTIYHMTPYSCFRTEIYINKVTGKESKNYIDKNSNQMQLESNGGDLSQRRAQQIMVTYPLNGML